MRRPLLRLHKGNDLVDQWTDPRCFEQLADLDELLAIRAHEQDEIQPRPGTWTNAGLPGYLRHTVILHGGMNHTVEGLVIETQAFGEFEGSVIDTTVVPGAPEVEAVLDESPETVAWLRSTAQFTRLFNRLDDAFHAGLQFS
jgi:hypothetical protein